MNRRDFLKTTTSITAGAALAHATGAAALGAQTTAPGVTAPSQGPRTNWAGTYTFTAPKVEHPATAAEVEAALKTAQHAKALGAGHSFNNIADSSGEQIAMLGVGGMSLDRAARTVTVGAGVKYGQFAPWLDQQGFAVHNLASLPHVTVAGACATGTHGSGVRNGCLSTAVEAFDLVDADGQVHAISRAANPDVFPGAVVAMGALGVVTKTTLRAVPRFDIAQVVYENLSFDQLEHNLDAIMGSGYSVSLFTTWQEHRANQVWLKQLPGGSTPAPGHYPATFYGATLQTKKMHPVPGHEASACTEQFGVPGPWYERLPHFKMDFTPSSGNEIQTEYLVPRSRAYEAILAVEKLRDKITPHLFITELRCIAADDLWMSMAYQRESLAIHFTWKPEADAVHAVIPEIERALKPFAARPHWAKVNFVPAAELKAVYPKYAEFAALMKTMDPQGKMRNAYLERVFPG
jgi:xylitol oxidase